MRSTIASPSDEALSELSDDFKAAVVLRDVADLNYDEIADALQIPIGTVKSRIARGRAALAESLPSGGPTGQFAHSARQQASGRGGRHRPPSPKKFASSGTTPPIRNVQQVRHEQRPDSSCERVSRRRHTPAERAQVDSDPTALMEVERLRQVRAVLSLTDSASISTRERHLATAFEVWDRMPTSEFSRDATPAGAESAAAAGQASITSPTSPTVWRQRSSSNRLLVLAAGLVVVLGGGVAARGFIPWNKQ